MNDVELDRAREVRPGEALDVDAVNGWIKREIGGVSGLPTVTQYSGGASNWTYCLSYPERDLILRRPPAGTKAKSAHDMGREYRVQKALKPYYPVVPDVLGLCQDESVIGAEFYVMARVIGAIPRARLPKSQIACGSSCSTSRPTTASNASCSVA